MINPLKVPSGRDFITPAKAGRDKFGELNPGEKGTDNLSGGAVGIFLADYLQYLWKGCGKL